MTYFFKTMPSPVGELKLIASDKGLCAILWERNDLGRIQVKPDTEAPEHRLLKQSEVEVKQYFCRTRTHFSLPLTPSGTVFQLKVWEELKKIPYGQRISYGELAKRLGNPKASRAVGAACGKNPLSIIVPCHRVVGASGKLTGFAGGIGVKEKLLNLEKMQSALE